MEHTPGPSVGMFTASVGQLVPQNQNPSILTFSKTALNGNFSG